MSVMRIHKNNNFTVMSNFHFREKKMSLKAKGLLSLMLSLPDDWDYSVAGLAKLSKDGRDSIMSALTELEKFGYLTRERVKLDNGQFGGVAYNIYEMPQTANPILEKSTLENSTQDKPILEKQEQLNTILIKDLFNKLLSLLNTNDEGLILLYQQYIQMREDMNAPLTPVALEKFVDRCNKLSNGNINVIKLILENAIINGWKNVYLPREEELEKLNQAFVDDFKAYFDLDQPFAV